MSFEELMELRFLEPIRKNKNNLVGLELEFPIIGRLPSDAGMARRLFDGLKVCGWNGERLSITGEPLFITAPDGGRVAFDSSYHNIEFVTRPAPSMLTLRADFRAELEQVGGLLARDGYSVLGLGLFPNGPDGCQRVRTQEGDLLNELLAPDNFFLDISSEQLHLNCAVERLPLALNTFAMLDFIFILLFADSPDLSGKSAVICTRALDYLKSPFRKMGLVGSQRRDYVSPCDIMRDYALRHIYAVRRDGKLRLLPHSAPLFKYFAGTAAREEDIFAFDSIRNLELSTHGTLEFRLNCSQRLDEAFAPSAFALGLFTMLEETNALMSEFYARAGEPDHEALMSSAALGMGTGLDESALAKCCGALYKLSEKGLARRGFGEDALLAPARRRIETMISPAAEFMRDARRLGLGAAIQKRTEQ